MPKMNPPHSTAVVDVSKNDADRYREAGWTEVKSSSGTTKKPAASKPSSDKK